MLWHCTGPRALYTCSNLAAPIRKRAQLTTVSPSPEKSSSLSACNPRRRGGYRAVQVFTLDLYFRKRAGEHCRGCWTVTADRKEKKKRIPISRRTGAIYYRSTCYVSRASTKSQRAFFFQCRPLWAVAQTLSVDGNRLEHASVSLYYRRIDSIQHVARAATFKRLTMR